uniref:RNA polymerase I subunit E n=1 Tax=Amphilophus citrinellus TaxID=61819 RepID=A0A3Q0RWW6_AMPCI
PANSPLARAKATACGHRDGPQNVLSCFFNPTVCFSNGTVQNADKLDFSMFKSAEESNPRKKSRRILVAETDRLSYVGQNFGVGSMKCNNLCKYYVGVLNKRTMTMEVHNAQLFNMQPVIPGKAGEDILIAILNCPKDQTLWRETV